MEIVTLQPTATSNTATNFGWELFMNGYNAAIKGADLADQHTADEQAGWWYARTPHTAGGVTRDADFIRHGGA